MSREPNTNPASRKMFRTTDQMDFLEEPSLEEAAARGRESGDGAQEGSRKARSVECLGMTFESEDARRAYFTERLREKLRDPEFRKIEGFPIGEDEDMLAMSDPPYYTACPNPFIADFVKHYGKPYDPSEPYSREPFAADVSEGKNDPIYNAHSYHTKVPHKAIMRYILHYTEPGDIVFDGFCGTGMAGVAAQMCGDRSAVEALDLRVQKDGAVFNAAGERIGKVGVRHAVLCDLSPIASFVTARYNDFQPASYSSVAVGKLLKALRSEFGDYYSTMVPNSNALGAAQFYVWSEVFACPHCGYSNSLFAFAVDPATYSLRNTFACPSCNADLSKESLDRTWTTSIDVTNGQLRKAVKCDLVEVSAQIGSGTMRFPPTKYDQERIEQISRHRLAWVPPDEFPHGRQTRKVKSGSGISTIQQMFTPRALSIVSRAWELSHSVEFHEYRHRMLFLLSSVLTLLSRRERFRDGTGKGAQSGTLYVPSIQVEKNAFDVIERKRKLFVSLGLKASAANAIVTCQSHADLSNIPDDSADYIFTDPPFGESLQYAELNFFHEAWFRVRTQIKQDCVLNYVHDKDLPFYQALVTRAFKEALRILKPGRWITVEFHNSQNSVWVAIQEALWKAGFTVADVRVLDKKQGTFNVVNRAGAVKQDLAISAYKASGELEDRFGLSAGTEDGAWDFVRNHLRQLPVFVSVGDQGEPMAERAAYLLFDRMVAFHVQRGVLVPMSAAEFYAGLKERFPERDGMYFLPDQVVEYDRKRQGVKEVFQLKLAPTDEATAIQWLRQQLERKPQTLSEIHPEYTKSTAGWERHEQPVELREVLAHNFLRYEEEGPIPEPIWAWMQKSAISRELMKGQDRESPSATLREEAKDRWYMPDPSRAQDLERLRERALLKEFEEYKSFKGRQMKLFRLEAVRTGFKKAWQERDYRTIIDVAGKIPEEVLQEDPKLLMWYDQALTRGGA